MNFFIFAYSTYYIEAVYQGLCLQILRILILLGKTTKFWSNANVFFSQFLNKFRMKFAQFCIDLFLWSTCLYEEKNLEILVCEKKFQKNLELSGKLENSTMIE